jgi:hypothetical protein
MAAQGKPPKEFLNAGAVLLVLSIGGCVTGVRTSP